MKKFGEVALLLLPVLMLGGIGWWKAAGGQRMASTWWEKANRGQIHVTKSFAWTEAPCDMAENVGLGDTHILIWVNESRPVWQRGEQYVPRIMRLDATKERPAPQGRPAGETVSSPVAYGRNNNSSGDPFFENLRPSAQFQAQATTWRVPKTEGEVRLEGYFEAKNLPRTPISIVARPAWMTQVASRLRVTRVLWQPLEKGQGGDVTVDLTYSGNKPVTVRGSGASTWSPRHVVPTQAQLAGDDSKDEVIAHWSQHIESGDGKYNSLKELEYQEVDLLNKAKVGQSIDSEGLANHFEPRVLPLSRWVQGKKVRIVYEVTSLPKSIKTPVFKAEIGLTGNGFVEVSCPLT